MDPVDAIFERHGIRGAWTELRTTGIANRVYATDDVVLRVAVATDEGLSDARTESIAAPAAHAAGIATPRMLAWDDSFFERPYSLWERVHGVTVESVFPDDRKFAFDRPTLLPPGTLWQGVGRELAKLHHRVRDVADPRGWLDQPEHARPREKLRELLAAGRIDHTSAKNLEATFERDEPLLATAPRCFVHDDLHAENVLVTRDGAFLAIIDWGDAGFGDPALDFQWMPPSAVDDALRGYGEVTPIDDAFLARVRWGQMAHMLDMLPRP